MNSSQHKQPTGKHLKNYQIKAQVNILIKLVKKEKKELSVISTYTGYGYIIIVDDKRNSDDSLSYLDLFVEVKCQYPENYFYPDIKFVPKKNKFEGSFSSLFKIIEGDENSWKKGLDNAFQFIREANALVPEILGYTN